ncbi:glycosyltransferase [Rhodobacteraceae bacterium]|nr:glycosyltransferase [Paracoccaceae bacterium]
MSDTLRDTKYEADEPVKISICTIAFNHADFLVQCIEGFLKQKCDFRVEIIIHDDASTDGTTEILNNYAARFPELIIPIYQTSNQYSKGVNPYYAYVFPRSRGEYIAICDGDDFWDDPDKLARQVTFLDEHPKTAITYGRVKAITDDGEIEPYRSGRESNLSADELKLGPAINTLTACFRNIFHDPPPPFIRSSPIGDMTIWAQLGYVGGGTFLPELLPAGYRLHQGGVFSLQTKSKKRFMKAISLLCVAAFHSQKGDRKALVICTTRAAIRLMQIANPLSMVATLSHRYFAKAIATKHE